MNRNDLGIFIENIDFELDKIRNNEAYINNKSYFGLDKELLSYIRKLEQALDEIEKYTNNFDVFKEFSFPLMKRWEEEQIKSSIDYEFKESIRKNILEIVQKAKGDVKNDI